MLPLSLFPDEMDDYRSFLVPINTIAPQPQKIIHEIIPIFSRKTKLWHVNSRPINGCGQFLGRLGPQTVQRRRERGPLFIDDMTAPTAEPLHQLFPSRHPFTPRQGKRRVPSRDEPVVSDPFPVGPVVSPMTGDTGSQGRIMGPMT